MSQSRVLRETPTDLQPVKKFRAIYKTRKFITVFTAFHQPLSQINPAYALLRYMLNVHFNIILPFRPLSSKWSVCLSAVPRNFFGGVQKIQLRTESRENGDLGALPPSQGFHSICKWVKPVFWLGCYGCIFHGTWNSAQLCQNFGISWWGGGGLNPKPPSVRHWSVPLSVSLSLSLSTSHCASCDSVTGKFTIHVALPVTTQQANV
jgi:hypothetical protein